MMRKRLTATTLATLAAVSTLGLAAAQPASATTGQCFYSQDWDGWKATPDSKTIYIRVGINHIWRMDLSSACPTLQAPWAHLDTRLHGSSSICSALDIDLRVSDGSGFNEPCIVSNLTPLSAAEASQLPKSLRP